MEVRLIDAEKQKLPEVISDISEGAKTKSYVIHGLTDEQVSELSLAVSHLKGWAFRTVLDRVMVTSSTIYAIPEKLEFFYNGAYLQTKQKSSVTHPVSSENIFFIFDEKLNLLHSSGSVENGSMNIAGAKLSSVLSEQVYQKLLPFLDTLQKEYFESFQITEGAVTKEYRVSRLHSAEPHEERYILLGTDVTEKERMEKAYYEMEAKYEYMTLTSREIIGLHSVDGRFIEVSPTSTEILGYTPRELIGEDPSQFFHPDDVQRVLAASHKLIFEGVETRNFQYRFKHKEGHYIWLEAFTDCIRDEEGRIVVLLSGSRDISELKEIELKLRESHERFRGISDNLPGVIYLCKNNEHFSMIYLNQEIENLTGYSVADFTEGRISFVELYHPEDRDEIFRQVNEALERKESFHLTYRLKPKDDHGYLWVEEYGQGIYKDGKLDLLEGVILDITERKETELKLIESDRRFRGIADNMPGVVYLCNNDKTYSMLYLNHEIENLTGYRREEFLKDTINMTDLYHPDDKEYIFRTFDEAMARKAPFHLTYRIKPKNHPGWVWVDEYGQGLYEGDSLKHIEGVIIDITAKMEAESKIRERQANLKVIMASTESMIGLFDAEMRVIEANDSLINYFLKYYDVDVRGKLVTELSFGTKEAFLVRLKAALQGESSRFDWHLVREGEDFYFQFRMNPVKINNEIIGASMFVENINELKKAQEELQRQNESLERIVAERTRELKINNAHLIQSNRELAEALDDLKKTQNRLVQAEKMASLGVLAAGVGHEINNPLNFIQNGAYGLMQELKEEGFKEDRYKPFLDIISDGVQRASKIVKSLSHFSRQVKTSDELCDVHMIVENCLLILQSKLKDRIKVIRAFCTDQPIVLGNEGRMHQAFLNILSNAEQAMNGEGELIITTNCNDDQVRVSFRDTGVGISEAHLNRIADPFFTTKDPGEGTGLGLFITFSIIQELNGEIEVNSEIGKGTEFLITFATEKEH